MREPSRKIFAVMFMVTIVLVAASGCILQEPQKSSVAPVMVSSPIGFSEEIGETTYAYGTNRTLTVTFPSDRTVEYQYDGAGNCIAMTTPFKVINYSYDDANRLIAAGNDTYIYDKNGNLLKKTVNGNDTIYTWDENKLVRVDYSDDTHNSYTYDASGRRDSKTDRTGKTTRYVYDGANLIQELDEKGTTIASYTYGGPGRPLSMTRNGMAYYYLYDGLGSVTGLTDEEGELVASYLYDPQGGIFKETGDIENPFKFTGQKYDAESGLYHSHAGYYDSNVGRSISKVTVPTVLFTPSVNIPSYSASYVSAPHIPSYNVPYIPPPASIQTVNPSIKTPSYSAPHVSAPHIPSYNVPYIPQVDVGAIESQRIKTLKQLQWDVGVKPSCYLIYGFFKAGEIFIALEPLSGIKLLPFIPSSSSILQSVYADVERDYHSHSQVKAPSMRTILKDYIVGQEVGWGVDQIIRSDTLIGSVASVFSKEVITGIIKNPHIQKSIHNVGGVSLNKAAEALLDLNEITGATYDEESGQLILIGKKNKALPEMNMDDLVVAIKAVYSGEDPGVSIDPINPGMYDGKMKVSYYGNTKNTHFGAVMFEADRYLKCLTLGEDTNTHNKVTPRVPGFKSELELFKEHGSGSATGNWHRMWFLPGELKLKESEDGKSIVFDEATIKVEARFVRFLPDGSKVDVAGSDPAVDEFVQFINENYDEFAAEKKELQELVQLAKMVSIVKWIKDNDIPFDLSWVEQYQVEAVETPATTSGMMATTEKQEGSYIYSFGLYGGVDFSKQNEYVQDAVVTKEIKIATIKARPHETAVAWDFEANGEKYTAVSLSSAEKLRSGSFTTSQVDVNAPTRGELYLGIARSYNSFNSDGRTEFGYGWSLVQPRLLIPSSVGVVDINGVKCNLPQEITLIGASGKDKKYVLSRDLSGRIFYFPERSDSQAEIDPNSDGTFTVIHSDNSQLNFDQQGKLLFVADRNGNKISYSYTNGLLTKIVDDSNRAIAIAYDDKKRIIQVTDPAQRWIKYAYDAKGNLESVDVNEDKTYYVYDANHRLTCIKDSENRVLIQNVYDDIGRVIKQSDAQGDSISASYDEEKRQDILTDSAGNKYIRSYDDKYRLIKETDPLGNSVTYTYDENERIASVTDKRGHTTHYEYDQQGNLIKIIPPDPLAAMTLWYDEPNNLVWVIDAKGRLTEHIYDTYNNLVEIREGAKAVNAARNTDGTLSLSVEGKADRITKFAYDKHGNLISITDPNGHTSHLEYDDFDNLIAIRDAKGAITRQNFDAWNRLNSITDPSGHTMSYEYDDYNNLIGVTAPEGTIGYEYDARNRLVKVTDINRKNASYVYNDNDQLTQVIGALGVKSFYNYDVHGNLVGITDANLHANKYEYEQLGRLIKETDPLGNSATYSYDPNGNLLGKTDSDGKTTMFTYDELNRLTEIKYSNGKIASYTYDETGRLTSMINDNGKTTYHYDLLGQLIKVSFPSNDRWLGFLGHEKSIKYSYDLAGNLKSITYPDKEQVQYEYDENNRLITVIDSSEQEVIYTYDDAGKILTKSLPNGINIEYTYDDAGHTVGIINEGPQGTILAFNYTLDKLGNRVKVDQKKKEAKWVGT